MPRSSVDYATDQITVYRYCPYGCRYCYVWRNRLFASRVTRGKYDPVEEARKYLNKSGRIIVVSFVSDPYPPEERERKLTRRVLEVLALNRANRVMVLTKNPLLALRDIDLYHGNMWLGTTIITLDEEKWRYWEPNTLYKPRYRLLALKTAHELGIHTWLSIEPIIPGTTYPETIVVQTIDYVDYYVLGAFNYTSQLGYTTYTQELLRKYYQKHVSRTIDILREHGIPYHVKKELARVLRA